MYQCFGADTETVKGEPLTYQIYSCDREEGFCYWVKPGEFVLKAFLLKLRKLMSPGKIAVVWIHNMDFDMAVLFHPKQSILLNTKAEFEIKSMGFKGSFLYGKAHILEGVFSDGARVICMDTFHYFPTSLVSLASTFQLSIRKLPKPRDLGNLRYKVSDSKFAAYAIRDAEISARIGEQILRYHAKFNVRLSLSAPQFASRVFRHSYIPQDSRIPFPKAWIAGPAISSYHGGRNGCYVPPGVYEGVSEYDITSAYPYAMTQLPNFLNCRYVATNKLEGGGIYDAEWSRQGEYPNLYSAANKLSDTGRGWVTGYELLSARRSGARYRIHKGYAVRSEANCNPIAEYVKIMFREKESLKPTNPLHHFYKVGLLNSLYGKFIQSVERNTGADVEFDSDGFKVESEKVFTAGGLFNPFIASLITGFTRAYLHDLECKYDALHSSTDSILTQKRPSETPGLGGLTCKYTGTLILIRCKLYLVLGPTGRIIKAALHGFWGTPGKLLKMIKEGSLEYEVNHMNKLRESLKRNLTPLAFETQTRSLNLLPEEWEKLRQQVKELGI